MRHTRYPLFFIYSLCAHISKCNVCQIIEDYCSVRHPQEQLDKRLYPYNWQAEIKSRKAPILHFGLVIEDKDVEYCIEKNNITIFRGTPLAERAPHGTHRLLAVMDFLREKHNIRTRNELVLGEGVFGREILALYNNYDEPLYQLVEEDEQEMLAIIREELGLKDQKAKWWWDLWWGTTYVYLTASQSVDVH